MLLEGIETNFAKTQKRYGAGGRKEKTNFLETGGALLFS